jgi:hypothetical protein
MATWVDMYEKGDVAATWQAYLSLVKEHRDTLSQPNITLWVIERATHMLAQPKGNQDDTLFERIYQRADASALPGIRADAPARVHPSPHSQGEQR